MLTLPASLESRTPKSKVTLAARSERAHPHVWPMQNGTPSDCSKALEKQAATV